MARREKVSAPIPAAGKLTAPPKPVPFGAPARLAPAVPTFPSPRVEAQTFHVIVCKFCAADRPFVVATRPELKSRSYECVKCALCPSCGTWNPMHLGKDGHPVFSRVVECRRCRTHDGDQGTLYQPEHGSRFKVPEKRPTVT